MQNAGPSLRKSRLSSFSESDASSQTDCEGVTQSIAQTPKAVAGHDSSNACHRLFFIVMGKEKRHAPEAAERCVPLTN